MGFRFLFVCLFFIFLKNNFVKLTAFVQSASVTREASPLFCTFLQFNCLLKAIKHFTLVGVPAICNTVIYSVNMAVYAGEA